MKKAYKRCGVEGPTLYTKILWIDKRNGKTNLLLLKQKLTNDQGTSHFISQNLMKKTKRLFYWHENENAWESQTCNRSGHKLCSTDYQQKFKRSQHTLLRSKCNRLQRKSKDAQSQWKVRWSIFKMPFKVFEVFKSSNCSGLIQKF